MNRELAVGTLLFLGGLTGYVVGTLHPFTGRAFSVTAVMLGLLLVAVGRAGRGTT